MKRPSGFDRSESAQENVFRQTSSNFKSPKENTAQTFQLLGTSSSAEDEREQKQTGVLATEKSQNAGSSGWFRADARDKEGLQAQFAANASYDLEQSVWDVDQQAANKLSPTVNADLKKQKRFLKSIKTRVRAARVERSGVSKAREELRRAKTQQFLAQRVRWFRVSAAGLRRAKIIGLVVGAVSVLAATVAVGVLTPVMSVRELRVEGASADNVQAFEDALWQLKGTPLALVDETDIYEALSEFDVIQRYSFETLPPDTLVVKVQERVPVIAVARNDKFLILDAAGVELAQTEQQPESVPVADGSVVDTASPAFKSASQVLRNIDESLRSQIDRVTASGSQDVTFNMKDGLTLKWGSAQESALKQIIFARMQQALEGQSVTLIDVSSTQAPVFE